jgi:hypothetical protein
MLICYRILFVLICVATLFSCEKSEDADVKKVYYATQPGYGGGGNPNPNGLPGSGTTGTPTNTVTCTRSMSVDGVSGSAVSSPAGTGANFIITVTSSVGTVTVTFATATTPAAGVYAIVAAAPVGQQCMVSYSGNNAVAGVVTVSTGTFNKAVLTNAVCGTNTVSATACY